MVKTLLQKFVFHIYLRLVHSEIRFALKPLLKHLREDEQKQLLINDWLGLYVLENPSDDLKKWHARQHSTRIINKLGSYQSEVSCHPNFKNVRLFAMMHELSEGRSIDPSGLALSHDEVLLCCEAHLVSTVRQIGFKRLREHRGRLTRDLWQLYKKRHDDDWFGESVRNRTYLFNHIVYICAGVMLSRAPKRSRDLKMVLDQSVYAYFFETQTCPRVTLSPWFSRHLAHMLRSTPNLPAAPTDEDAYLHSPSFQGRYLQVLSLYQMLSGSVLEHAQNVFLNSQTVDAERSADLIAQINNGSNLLFHFFVIEAKLPGGTLSFPMVPISYLALLCKHSGRGSRLFVQLRHHGCLHPEGSYKGDTSIPDTIQLMKKRLVECIWGAGDRQSWTLGMFGDCTVVVLWYFANFMEQFEHLNDLLGSGCRLNEDESLLLRDVQRFLSHETVSDEVDDFCRA